MSEPLKIPYDSHSICERAVYSVIIKLDNKYNFKNVHPNIITLFRILFYLLALYLYNKYKTFSSKLLLILSVLVTLFLDYLDGYVARKYNKCTVFGDILDHVSDWIVHISLYIIIKNKTKLNNFLILLHVLLVISYMGAYQLIYKESVQETETESLDFAKCLVIFNKNFHLLFSDVTLYLHFIILFIFKNI